MDLCGGELRNCIDHPILTNSKLFLMFDSTHNLKNIFNNWVSKKLFQFPAGHIGENEILADFNHVQQLFALEETKPLKVAHRLNATAISPDNIEKQSLKHALGKCSFFPSCACNCPHKHIDLVSENGFD